MFVGVCGGVWDRHSAGNTFLTPGRVRQHVSDGPGTDATGRGNSDTEPDRSVREPDTRGSRGFTQPAPVAAIETAFPYREVNRLAALESYNKHHYRPTNYQHKWWARRLGSVFRSICIAALSEPGLTAEELWERYHDPPRFDQAIVLDPFMGGGTTGQEATRLGARFVGTDLNPVAWYVARMALAPAPLGLDAAFQRVRNRWTERVGEYYETACPDCPSTATAKFFLWVRVEPAAEGAPIEPAVRETTSQESASTHLEECGPTSSDGENAWIRRYDSLVVNHDGDGGATVVCPDCHALHRATDPDAATCPGCDRDFDATGDPPPVHVAEPSIRYGGGDRPAYEPYAVRVHCEDCGSERFVRFRESDADRLRAARDRFAAEREALPLPDQPIPTGGEKTRDLRAKGYTHWIDLFNDRQLLAMGTLLEEIRALEDPAVREYLSLTCSAALEFNTMFCSFKGANPRSPGAVRHTFSHHAFVHPGEPLENNPLGAIPRQSGTVPFLYDYRLKRALEYQETPEERVLGPDGTVADTVSLPGERIGGRPADTLEALLEGPSPARGGPTHHVACTDSAALELAAGSVDAVITDPPYFDSVQYAELADFFHVWLKAALEPDFPGPFAPDSVVTDREAVGNASRERSLTDYRRLLQGVFETAAHALGEDGILAFTFHHKAAAAWAAVLEALTGAGFRVVATYPVRGENRRSVHIDGQRAIQLDSVIVCRPIAPAGTGTATALVDEVRNRASDRLESFHATGDEDLSRLDASVVLRGVWLTACSRYETILNGDGGVVGPDVVLERVERGVETNAQDTS